MLLEKLISFGAENEVPCLEALFKIMEKTTKAVLVP